MTSGPVLFHFFFFRHSFTNAPNSLVRVQQYMALLDGVMQEILNWSMGAEENVVPGVASAPSAAVAVGGGGKGMGAGGKGMGGGAKGKAKGGKKAGGFG